MSKTTFKIGDRLWAARVLHVGREEAYVVAAKTKRQLISYGLDLRLELDPAKFTRVELQPAKKAKR